MTAQIAIMNRRGLALASDSAMTLSNVKPEKTYTTHNKLFSLSKYHPVGIMVYENGNFMGIPWDSIIVTYRETNSSKSFDTLSQYVADFLKFLENEAIKKLVSETQLVKNNFRTYLDDEIFNQLSPDLQELRNNIRTKLNSLKNLNILECFNTPGFVDQFFQAHSQRLKEVIQETLKHYKFKLTDTHEIESDLLKIAGYIFSTDVFINYTGVVIAGYGTEEYFPSLQHFFIEGLVNGKLKWKLKEEYNISLEDGKKSFIIPFAQQESEHSFFAKGIDPFLHNAMVSLLGDILDLFPGFFRDVLTQLRPSDATLTSPEITELKSVKDTLLHDITMKLGELESDYESSLLQKVEFLPETELANIAEAFIYLTSIKHKANLQLESVGGPTDVALISKSQGFVWIKNKS